jgi:hypothetical protein
MKTSIATLAGFAALAIAGSAAHAATVSQTLGTVVEVGGSPVVDGQAFASGAFTGSSDPAPFDVPTGTDGSGPNFSATWTFNYAAPLGPVNSGLLEFGLYDGDSAASGDQVALFTLNGFDLTAELNAILEGKPGLQSSENFYSLTLPGSVYADLATGTATFALTLKGPGLGILGETPNNGATLDFATLTVGSRDVGGPPGIPEPGTWALMLAGFGLTGAELRRRRAAAA